VSDTKVVGSAPVMGDIHEVRATFATPDLMQNAVTRLEMSGFDRADLSLPEVTRPDEFATSESSAKPADTEEDARQARTLQTSAAAAIAAMAAGGAVIATGGAVAPALAAAVVGGGMFGSAAYAISSASNSEEQEDRERKAATGTLVLSVRAPSEAGRRRGYPPFVWRDLGPDPLTAGSEPSRTRRVAALAMRTMRPGVGYRSVVQWIGVEGHTRRATTTAVGRPQPQRG
jgi:hypothetical protein